MAIDYSTKNYPGASLEIYTDSQYVVSLPVRMEKLLGDQFITKKGNILNNSDLLHKLILLIKSQSITFHKVMAHQKISEQENLNREADMICRKIMRENQAE